MVEVVVSRHMTIKTTLFVFNLAFNTHCVRTKILTFGLTEERITFTSVSVKFAVADLIRETLELMDDDDDDPSWLPSEKWCYWFLHKEMNLTMRRTNGTPPCPEDEEKQEALHNATILRLCYLIRVEKLPSKRVFASDESGCHLFPQAKWRWE